MFNHFFERFSEQVSRAKKQSYEALDDDTLRMIYKMCKIKCKGHNIPTYQHALMHIGEDIINWHREGGKY